MEACTEFVEVAEAYRLGLFAADVGWRDVTKLFQDGRTRSLADQLYRALGSVSANVAEGHSRGSSKTPPLNPPPPRGGKPRRGRGGVIVPQQRGCSLREPVAVYQANPPDDHQNALETLLHNVPF